MAPMMVIANGGEHDYRSFPGRRSCRGRHRYRNEADSNPVQISLPSVHSRTGVHAQGIQMLVTSECGQAPVHEREEDYQLMFA